MASYGLEKRRLDTPIALPRRVLPPVALPLMAPHGQDPFGVPTRFMELTVYLRFPAYMYAYSGITHTLTSNATWWPYPRFNRMNGLWSR